MVAGANHLLHDAVDDGSGDPPRKKNVNAKSQEETPIWDWVSSFRDTQSQPETIWEWISGKRNTLQNNGAKMQVCEFPEALTFFLGGAEIKGFEGLVGFTKHGLNRIIQRGITPKQIQNTLKYGERTIQTIKNQQQLKLVYDTTTLIIGMQGRNLGKIITAY